MEKILDYFVGKNISYSVCIPTNFTELYNVLLYFAVHTVNMRIKKNMEMLKYLLFLKSFGWKSRQYSLKLLFIVSAVFDNAK